MYETNNAITINLLFLHKYLKTYVKGVSYTFCHCIRFYEFRKHVVYEYF